MTYLFLRAIRSADTVNFMQHEMRAIAPMVSVYGKCLLACVIAVISYRGEEYGRLRHMN